MSNHRWAVLALLSLCAITFGELFEQVVFVPNWLVGDIDANMEHFRRFKHTADPGMFYFPVSLVALISHLMLLRAKSGLAPAHRRQVKGSLVLFLVVLAITGFVIAMINVPVIDQGKFVGEAQRSKMLLWALVNPVRVILPFLAIRKLWSMFEFRSA